MLDVLKSIGIGGVLVLVGFYLVRDVLSPLVKSVTRRKGQAQESSEPGRVMVMEINLSKLTTRVEDFARVLAEQNEMVDKLGQAVDNKMDMVLQELSEIRSEFAEAYRTMTERITRAETHIEHLFKTRGARGAN